jgi:membrane protein implicated in regulation of membrane protease activity
MQESPLPVTVAIIASIPGMTYAGIMRDDISDFVFVLLAGFFILAGVGVTDGVPLLAWIGSTGMFVSSSLAALQIFRRRRRRRADRNSNS